MEFIYDIESTGLPKFSAPKRKRGEPFPAPSDFASYDSARVVSICWLIIDKQTKEVVQQEYYVIKPDGFEISQEATNIHGISTQFAEQFGIPLNVVLERAFAGLQRCESIIAYNVEFDYNVLKSEFLRADMQDAVEEIDNKIQKCAMLMAQSYMRAPYFPRLGDAYRYIFRRPIENAHNAIADTINCYRCYVELSKSI